MRATAPRAALFALAAAGAAALAGAAPSGCFYPDYTFEGKGTGGESAGPGPGSTTHSSSGSHMVTSSSSHTSTTSTTSSGNGGGGGEPSGGGGSGPGSSSSAGGSGTENCLNGLDDDGNGMPDCADPACSASVSCFDAVPTGWTGYFALYDGPAAQVPGCPARFPSDVTPKYSGNAGLAFDPADCVCHCGNPTGETCNFPTEIDVWDAPDCNSTNCSFQFVPTPGWTGSCDGDTYVDGGNWCGAGHGATCSPSDGTMTSTGCAQSISIGPATVTGGSCAPSTVTTNKPLATWARLGRGCGDVTLTGVGCGGGQQCLPRPGGTFQTGVCISHDGEMQCPPGQFTHPHTFYEAFTDSRACSGSCACDDPSGGTCTASIHLFKDLTINTCNTEILQGPFTSGTCKNITGSPNVAGHTGTKTAATGGSCNPDVSGVSASGEVVEDVTTATTFCCSD